MWPTLLNLTRDDCRRTLRRLELEAYSNMINVLRAQGAFEDTRRKLLEDLRTVLRISHERHTAEARRVANDELLATIAEQVAGPNTGLGWICEGRRKVPLMPRGIPQSMFTEYADKIAESYASENKKIKKRKNEEKTVSYSNEQESETEEMVIEEYQYPIAMEDPTSKLWETEIINRKRKPDVTDETPTPAKYVRNIPPNTNQKHVNLSNLYSKFSQPVTNKSSSQSKHSYNQVSKVSTIKSNQTQKIPKVTKQKLNKQNNKQVRNTKKNAQKLTRKPRGKLKKSQEPVSSQPTYSVSNSPSKYNFSNMQVDFSGPPNTFLASYTQSLLAQRPKDETKSKFIPSNAEIIISESNNQEELNSGVSIHENLIQIQNTPTKQIVSATKPCQLVLKKKPETPIAPEKKIHIQELKVLQKPYETVKIMSNRQVVGPATPKTLTTGKIIPTKVIGPVSKTISTTPVTEKMIVVSKGMDHKILANSKFIIATSSITSQNSSTPVHSSVKTIESNTTPKSIVTADVKVSAKTFLLNPKPGQKMVVVPARARTKSGNESQVPLIQFKGITTPMRLVPVSQAGTPIKTSTITVLPQTTTSSTVKGSETIKTANMADIVPIKGLTPIANAKGAPVVRPSSAKGNLIVVQKGTTIGKSLTFSKNGNDMSKIIMGKNITQLMQAKENEGSKSSNVILLDLNNEHSTKATTMSEILDSRSASRNSDNKDFDKIENAPVIYTSQITEETCNTSSLESAVDSIGDIVSMANIETIPSDKQDEKSEKVSVTDWEIELDSVVVKDKDEKSNSLELEMLSDSDSDFMSKAKCKESPQDCTSLGTPTEEDRRDFEQSSAISHTARTLLSQLQDDGSSSNDSAFNLKSKKNTKTEIVLNKSESDELTKVKENLSKKVAKSQQQRIDVYSTAIASTEINLDSFSYLEDEMMAGDDDVKEDTVSIDSQTVSDCSTSKE